MDSHAGAWEPEKTIIVIVINVITTVLADEIIAIQVGHIHLTILVKFGNDLGQSVNS
jgi:hypothetical protein